MAWTYIGHLRSSTSASPSGMNGCMDATLMSGRPTHRHITRAIVRALTDVRAGRRRLPSLPPASREVLSAPERARDRVWLRASLQADVGLTNRTLEMLGNGRNLKAAFETHSPRRIYTAAVVAVFERDLLQSMPADVAMVLRRRAMRRAAVAQQVARVAGSDPVLSYVDALLADLGALILLRLDPTLAERLDQSIDGVAAPDCPEIDRIVALVGDELMDRTIELWLGSEWSQRRPPAHVRQVTTIIYQHTRRAHSGDARVLGSHELAPLVRLGIEARTFSELCNAALDGLNRPAA